jgi:tRNA pseudouridine13 synthase
MGIAIRVHGSDIERLPYVTPKMSRICGKIRSMPEDFQVDEIASYRPGGNGAHLFVLFRKTGLTTPEAVKRLALALETSPDRSSWAGLKDRDAVTTQWASFPGGDPERALALRLENISVLEAAPNPRKIRTGHLAGNRFRIRIRETPRDSLEVARSLFRQLERIGVPNYYGEQRFGHRGGNLEKARRWILEGGSPPRDRFLGKLLFSSLQSAIFNDWLAHRIGSGTFAEPAPGDLVKKEDTGGIFVARELDEVRSRMNEWQVSVTGPIFGARMRWPELESLDVEESVLQAWGIDMDTLGRFRKYGTGSRRVARIRPLDWEVQRRSDSLVVSFRLRKGAYATSVMRELLKLSVRAGE